MTFRRVVLAGIVWCSALPGLAHAQSAREVDIGYALTYLTFTGFRIDFRGRFDGQRYDVESHTFKEGLIKAVTINYEGKNRAWGGFLPQGAQPAAGSLSIAVGDKARSWLAQYGNGSMVQDTSMPQWTPPPGRAIPPDERANSLDPLSAAVTAGMAGDAACDRTLPTNDGKRRIDIILKKVGTESPETAGVPEAKGDLLVCEIYTRRVAGDFEDAPKEAESKREQPMKIWMAHLDDTAFRYPAKLEAQTGFGTIRGKILFFRERPLTDAEKAAMPH